MAKKFTTLTAFLNSRNSSISSNDIVEFDGFTTVGDGSRPQWRHDGTTGQTPSQSPAQLVDGRFTDLSGNRYEYVKTAKINILDFGADKTGGTSSNGAINAAIAYAERTSKGSTIFFPAGTYLIDANIRIRKGVFLEGEGFTDESSAATPNDALTKFLWDAGAGAITMVTFQSATLGNRIFYGGIDGILLDGNNVASTCLKLSSTQGTRIGVIFTYRPIAFGTIINNDNDALNSNVHIDTLRHFNGGNAATANTHGLFIDGDQHSSGATSVRCIEYEAEYDDGDGLRFRAVDTCYFAHVKTIARNTSYLFGGSSNGEGVRYLKSATALEAQKNFIAHLGRGTVFVEDNTVANAIGFFNGEGGAIQFEDAGNKGTFYYQCVDRIDGDQFETPVYAMQQFLDINVLSMTIAAGTPNIPTAGSFPLTYYAFGSGSTETIVSMIAPNDKWNTGNITGFQIGLVPVGSTTPNNVRFEIKLSTMGSGIGPGAGEKVEAFTFTISASTTVNDFKSQLFTTPLIYTLGDAVAISISRLGADGADTFPNDCGVSYFQLIHESDGPNSAGTGPWEIPARQI